MTTGELSKAKNSEREMWNASQILMSDGMEGLMFFLNHEEIVVCAIPDSSERRYSVHPRSFFS